MRGRRSFRDFCQKYFPHYMEQAPSEEFHFWLMDRLYRLPRGSKEIIVAPRGYAKSSIISVMYILYCICEKTESYIILISDTFSQAAQHLKNVKLELEKNEKLAEDYPDACGIGATWSKEAIVATNGVKVDVLGTGGKIRGRREGAERPSLIIGDDLENDESAASPTMRENTRTWFNSGVLKAGGPKTNVIVIGTMINIECLVAWLLGQPGWKGKLFKAIMEWPTHMWMWDEWEKLLYQDEVLAEEYLQAHIVEMSEGAKVLWPEREPLIALMKMRAGGHLSFQSEKQNDPANPAKCAFEEGWFDGDDLYYDTLPGNAIGFIACDPTVGKDVRKGDYVGLVMVWWAKGDPHLYVDAIIERMSSSASVTKVLDLDDKHHFVACAWESNAAQAIIAGQLAEASAKRGKFLNVVEITHNQDKVTRIQKGLEPYLQRRALKFKRGSKGVKQLLKDTRMFPIADHDDGPDALEMGVRLVKDWVGKHAA